MRNTHWSDITADDACETHIGPVLLLDGGQCYLTQCWYYSLSYSCSLNLNYIWLTFHLVDSNCSFCILFCRSLCVLLSFLFWPLCCGHDFRSSLTKNLYFQIGFIYQDWKYQRGNKKLQIKEDRQYNGQRENTNIQNITQKTNDLAKRIPLDRF